MAENTAVMGPTTEMQKEFDFSDWLKEDGGAAGRISHYAGAAAIGGVSGWFAGKFIGHDQPFAKFLGAAIGTVAMYKCGPELFDDIGDAMKSVNQDVENGKLEKGFNLKERFSRIVGNFATKDGQSYQAVETADPDPDIT